MIRMKKFEGFRNTYMEAIEGTEEWYYCKECAESFCDLYEAEEIVQKTGSFQGATVKLIHYPDGKVYEPFPLKRNRYMERPVYIDGKLAFLEVDFEQKMICIHQYEVEKEKLSLLTKMPLNCVKDCYNLALMTRPLTLGKSGNEGVYEMIWPEQKVFPIEQTESVLYRDQNKLYSSRWVEEPEYMEFVVVRDIETGEVIEEYEGSMYHMPDGRFWIVS